MTINKLNVSYISMLADVFKKRAKTDKTYSLRKFAAEIDIDPGSLSRILNGSRALTYTKALHLINYLGFTKEEKETFLESVSDALKTKGDVQNALAKLDAAKSSKISPTRRKLNDKLIKKIELTPEQIERQEIIKEATSKIGRSVVKNYNRPQTVFITGVVQGAEVKKSCLASIETFLRFNRSDFVISSIKAHLKALSDEEYPLDDIILDRYSDCVYENVEFSKYVKLINFKTNPQKGDPLSGKQEFGASESLSFFIPHPQQRWKTYPAGREDSYRIQATTGVISESMYRDSETGIMADERHKMGGVVLEIYPDGLFNARRVQFAEDGSFIDFGRQYNPDGTTKSLYAEYIRRGDDHVGFSDKRANRALDEITSILKPKKLLVEDLYDGASISHHNANSISARLGVPAEIDTLEKELNLCREHLIHLNKVKPKDCEIIVVASNHHDHLDRFLDDKSRVFSERVNINKAVELLHAKLNLGKDPLIYAVDPEEKLATWLRRGDKPLIICDVVVSSHGDKGPNGSRGSVKTDASSYGKNSSGHSHSPEIWRDAIRVGTLSRRDMPYTIGSPSSWAHACEIAFKGTDGVAQRQLIFINDGRYRFPKEMRGKGIKAKTDNKLAKFQKKAA